VFDPLMDERSPSITSHLITTIALTLPLTNTAWPRSAAPYPNSEPRTFYKRLPNPAVTACCREIFHLPRFPQAV
jgi:hypothetical protein